ncbi:MAG: hypothetical protein VX288_04945, partial [Planctomycetota bacterium]|nr:hypothetical protein [Planctomycetota bacterium]
AIQAQAGQYRLRAREENCVDPLKVPSEYSKLTFRSLLRHIPFVGTLAAVALLLRGRAYSFTVDITDIGFAHNLD